MGYLRLVCALALLASASAAQAEVYAGGSLLSSEYDKYDDVGRGTGGKLFLGYHFDSAPILLEAAHFDAGNPKINDFTYGSYSFTNDKLGFSGNNYSVGYYGHGGPGLPVGFWLKAGYCSGTSTLEGRINGTPFKYEEASKGASWGLGLDWMFSRYVGALLDIEGLGSVKTTPQVSNEHSTMTLFSLGLIVEFPQFGGSAPASPPGPHAR